MDSPDGNNRSFLDIRSFTGLLDGDGASPSYAFLTTVGFGAFVAILLTIYRPPWYANNRTKDQKDMSVLEAVWTFFYSYFLKAQGTSSYCSQQDALEAFERSQARIYDVTCKVLLKGREDMLCLCAAQLKHRQSLVQGPYARKQIWIDIGGGTGWNIEEMSRFIDVQTFFGQVYLVELSPSLCEIARKRFARLGWRNVQVVCEDAREFSLEDIVSSLSTETGVSSSKATLVTLSYSLSMIVRRRCEVLRSHPLTFESQPDFHSVADSIQRHLLSSEGLLGVVDFYVQSGLEVRNRSYIGGSLNRHVGFFPRVFWRTWFDLDRVYLEPSRRDYLEYRFGTLVSVSDRNTVLGSIPFYIWLGTQRNTASLTGKSSDMGQLRLQAELPLSSCFYQNYHWRMYYNDHLKKHTQFHNEYIYAFTWEDSDVDRSILALNSEDEVLAITSAGDNVLSYLKEKPAKLHAVDVNPCQNHLLELKVAAFCSLQYEDFWKIFGEGKHPEFRTLLLSKLSPYLSSYALQYWRSRCSIFEESTGGLYDSGGSRHGIRIFHWISVLLGFRTAVQEMLCETQTLPVQNDIWQRRVRPRLLAPLVNRCIVSQPRFLWTALGVPRNQLAMIEADHAVSDAVHDPVRAADNTRSQAIWEYMSSTLDPVLANSLIAARNPYYYVCLARRFSRSCHPDYLSPAMHAQLASPTAFRSLRIYTDEVQAVLATLPPGSLTVAVLMDSMDWFDPGSSAAEAQVENLNRALKVGGRVMIRSAGLRPWYLNVFSLKGFRASCVSAREQGACIDRVNMYASCWVMTKERGLDDACW